MTTADERRKSPRYAVDVAVRLVVGTETVAGRLKDICRDAALVEADKWYPLETEVILRTELPDTGGPLEARGRVIRLAAGEQGTHGLAILFDTLSPAAATRVDFFIARQEE